MIKANFMKSFTGFTFSVYQTIDALWIIYFFFVTTHSKHNVHSDILYICIVVTLLNLILCSLDLSSKFPPKKLAEIPPKVAEILPKLPHKKVHYETAYRETLTIDNENQSRAKETTTAPTTAAPAAAKPTVSPAAATPPVTANPFVAEVKPENPLHTSNSRNSPDNELLRTGAEWLTLNEGKEVKGEEQNTASAGEVRITLTAAAARSRGRKRPNPDVTARPSNPTKQRAGLRGVEVRAEERALSEKDKSDDVGPVSKKGKQTDDAEDSTATRKDPAKKAAKADQKEQVEILSLPRIMDPTEYIDDRGHKFVINYSQATTDEKDTLWTKLAVTAARPREEVDHKIQDLSLTEAEMKTIDLQRSAILFPALLQNDGKLRLRRQQELHKHVTAKAVTPLLRKIERAAYEILLVISELESPADPITQARMITRLLELPKSERSISSKEHNDIVNGHTFYLGAIAEKLRVDLAYIHLTLEKFVQKATGQEHRLAALYLGS